MTVLFNKGTKELEKGNYQKALSYFKKEPAQVKEKYLNMGNAYKMLGNIAEAEKCFTLAASSSTPFFNLRFGEYPLALNNLGLIHYAKGDDDTAISYYNKALEIDDTHFDSVWNYGTSLLRKFCNYENVDPIDGWKAYEFRFKKSVPVGIDRSYPRWNEISSGERIVVLAEQGIGDKVMFARYLPKLKNFFKEVIVQCSNSIDPLFVGYRTVEVIDFDCVTIPICSLARIFDPYIEVPGDWLSFVTPAKSDITIVEWGGSVTHANNNFRSCPWHYFSRFDSVYNLNPRADNAKIPKLKLPWLQQLAIIKGCKRVITVDTSLAHIAGSLGVETYVLMPLIESDFRWGREGTKNRWYSSVHVVRNPGSWDKTFEELECMLRS